MRGRDNIIVQPFRQKAEEKTLTHRKAAKRAEGFVYFFCRREGSEQKCASLKNDDLYTFLPSQQKCIIVLSAISVSLW